MIKKSTQSEEKRLGINTEDCRGGEIFIKKYIYIIISSEKWSETVESKKWMTEGRFF